MFKLFSKIVKTVSASAIIATVMRVIQLLTVIETKTGFLKTDRNSIYIIVGTYIVIALAFIATVLANTLWIARQPLNAPNPKNSVPLSIISNVLAFYCLYSSAKYALSGIALINVLLSLLALVCGIYFVLFSISGVTKINLPRIMSLSPVAFVLTKTLVTFFNFNGMAVISENVLEILFYCANCIYFLKFAKIIYGTEIRKSSRGVLLFGNISFVLALVSQLSPIVVRAIGKDEVLHSSAGSDPATILFGTFAFIFTLALYSKNNIEKRENEEKVDILEIETQVDDNNFYYNKNGK